MDYGGGTIVLRTLRVAPQVQNLYFRLPDGNVDGSGYGNGNPSLINLYLGYITSLDSIDGSATYSLAALSSAIGSLISGAQPVNVLTLDYLSDYGSGDHTDHLTVSRLAAGIIGNYAPAASLSGFMGYPVCEFRRCAG